MQTPIIPIKSKFHLMYAIPLPPNVLIHNPYIPSYHLLLHYPAIPLPLPNLLHSPSYSSSPNTPSLFSNKQLNYYYNFLKFTKLNKTYIWKNKIYAYISKNTFYKNVFMSLIFINAALWPTSHMCNLSMSGSL